MAEQVSSPQSALLRVVVVTGMSGAGRSTAARALEDLGWYVVDNMPPTLIGGIVELARSTPSLSRLAVVVDARGGAFFAELERSLFVLRQEDTDLQVVFLEATDEVLVRRFESSRRPHPMQGSGWLLAGIDSERTLLANLRGSADLVIDTSRMSVHDLRRRIESMFSDGQVMRLRATLMSFGFKYGIPVDADIVFDARFLPNPYWVPELRPSTGLDGPVSDYVLEQRDARPFLDNAARLIDLMAGGYLREGKRFVTIAVGCTGGKHRSVALAENLAARLVKVGVETSTVHRDLGEGVMLRPGQEGAETENFGPRVVGFGGGHGLAVSLKALRRITDRLTAVVGVADDGGSSGMLRQQFGVLPPGDLRMALAALCGDDVWGSTWSRAIQHRFGGNGELRGHSLGNLLIAALWEQTGDVVAGLDLVASLLGARGRVLPVCLAPLEFVAEVILPGDTAATRVRGQAAVARTTGTVQSVRLEPSNPPPCTETVAAIAGAEHLLLGPGSWYTSVTAPLLVSSVREAFLASPAQRTLVVNLCPQAGETSGFAQHTHLEVFRRDFPDIRLDRVICDPAAVTDLAALERAAAALGADVVLRPLALGDPADGLHDPDLLAAAFAVVMGRGSIAAWR